MRSLVVTLVLLFAHRAWAQPYAPEPEPSVARLVVGGVAGTFIGFGLGHAIQGRFGDSGWVYLVGEGAGLGFAAFAGCQVPSGGSCNSMLLALGMVTYMGFHVAEIIDVWRGPPTHGPQLYALPHANPRGKTDGAVAGVSLRF